MSLWRRYRTLTKFRPRTWLDAWFWTLARYSGLALLIYSLAIDRFKNPALLPGAIGLMALKNVVGGGEQ